MWDYYHISLLCEEGGGCQKKRNVEILDFFFDGHFKLNAKRRYKHQICEKQYCRFEIFLVAWHKTDFFHSMVFFLEKDVFPEEPVFSNF